MRRKIIKQGVAGKTIYLPKKWVDNNNLKAGDDIDIQINNNTLEARPLNYKTPEKKIELNCSDYKKLIRRKFDNVSKRGYDEIKIGFEKEEDLEPIKESLASEATIFEILKKEKNHLTLKAISETNIEELNNLQNRLIFLLLEKVSKIEEYIETKNQIVLKDIIELEKANNHLAHICMRAIHKQALQENSYMKYTFIWAIEKLGNQFKFLAITELKSISSETNKLLIETMKNVRLFTKIYFSNNTKKAVELYEERKNSAEKMIQLLSNNKNSQDNNAIHLMLNINEQLLYLLGLLFGMENN